MNFLIFLSGTVLGLILGVSLVGALTFEYPTEGEIRRSIANDCGEFNSTTGKFQYISR